MGNIYYNISNKQWEIEPNKLFVNIKKERFHLDRLLILKLMNEKYKTDVQMINYSLKEQENVLLLQQIKNMKLNVNTRIN